MLELGAGTLNHLPFESAGQDYDVVEPYTALYEGRPEAARVRTFHADIDDVPRDHRYDRIISIATLEHVLNLPQLGRPSGDAARARRPFAAGIPSEGGFLWGLAWRSSVGLSFRLRTGLNYGDLMRHEHANRADRNRSDRQALLRARRDPPLSVAGPSSEPVYISPLRRAALDRCRALLGK